MMKRFQAEGCGLWAVLALVVILLCTGLLVYIDRTGAHGCLARLRA